MSTRVTKYVARFDGKIIGKRSSHRGYSHAVVVQHDVERARKQAYDYVATDVDRKNFEYDTEVAACEGKTIAREPGLDVLGRSIDAENWGGEMLMIWNRGNRSIFVRSKTEIAQAKANIAGGYDAYIARVRQDEIDRFERRLANGDFNPYVSCWCGRPDLAQKAANERRKYCRMVAIVAAEIA